MVPNRKCSAEVAQYNFKFLTLWLPHKSLVHIHASRVYTRVKPSNFMGMSQGNKQFPIQATGRDGNLESGRGTGGKDLLQEVPQTYDVEAISHHYELWLLLVIFKVGLDPFKEIQGGEAVV
jgi:hypothetical protein